MTNTIVIQGQPEPPLPTVGTIPAGTMFYMPSKTEWTGQVFMKVEREQPYGRMYVVHLRTGKAMLVTNNSGSQKPSSYLSASERVVVVSNAVTVVPEKAKVTP